jgi:two-component system phosphate regulon response regulator PhoB
MPSILVIEDEPAIRELLKVNLVAAGYDVQEAPDAERAQAALTGELPDLLLLDWMLPGQSGLALARQLRGNARTRGLPIIMLTARSDEADKVAGLEAWVDDYVTKPFSPRELKARIKSVLRRRAPEAAQEALEVGSLRLDPVAHRVSAGGGDISLGPTEFRLLQFLMARPDRVHTRMQLLDRVWGDHVYIEERTVDVHIRRLRLALERHGVDRMIETVRGTGYRLVAKPSSAAPPVTGGGSVEPDHPAGPVCAGRGGHRDAARVADRRQRRGARCHGGRCGRDHRLSPVVPEARRRLGARSARSRRARGARRVGVPACGDSSTHANAP